MPQDDTVHAELPLRPSLRYAARLRLPSSSTPAEVDAAVDGALAVLDLTGVDDVTVAALSGGQRKRASIHAGITAVFLGASRVVLARRCRWSAR